MSEPAPFTDDWSIRVEWRRDNGVTLSITGRTETREGLEAFIRDLEMANDFLAATIEAHSERPDEQFERTGA